jgi:hypothetical protein
MLCSEEEREKSDAGVFWVEAALGVRVRAAGARGMEEETIPGIARFLKML